MIELHNRWRGFAADRAKARKEVDQQIEQNNAEIERLRLENINLNTSFSEKWTKEKKELQEARDMAVMDAMASEDRGGLGWSGQKVLRELGSRNTVWIYDLRKRLAAEGRLPEGLNENSPAELLKAAGDRKASAAVTARPALLENVHWLSSDHQGVVGWLVSTDYRYIKMYATDGVLEGEWFVCEDKSYEFVAGNEQLFKATKRSEIIRRTNLLKSILDDTYGGQIKEVDNPYID
jgi:hypothetical protein